MPPIRVGCVKYLNTLPLIEGLAASRQLDLIAAVPSKLIGLLESSQIDIGFVSLIDAARTLTPLTLLPVGCIGCDGPTLTVRLFSAVPFERVETVHADTDSHTSIALAQIILARSYHVRPRVVEFDARERTPLKPLPEGIEREWPETLLIIGDKVVTDSPPAVRYPHQLDLGEAWKALTGLPFVYAMWMCRAADADQPGIRMAVDLLDRQRRRNTARLDWVVERYAKERGWPEDLARTYVGTYLRYSVGPRQVQAVERFLSEVAELMLAPRVHPRWLVPVEPVSEPPTVATRT